MAGYTPWRRIFSYDADVSIVIEARGHGKTYGLREQCLRDWLERRDRFCVVVRYKDRIPDVGRDYFGALYKPGRDGYPTSRLLRDARPVFHRKGYTLYAQLQPPDTWTNPAWKPDKNRWEPCGYFVALSAYQDVKELTFARVRRVVFDEALIENPDGRRDYLPGEYDRLVSVVDSVTRERPGGDAHKPNVYLLANAAGSIANPYFAHFGIRDVPPPGFSWWAGKTCLLYVGRDTAYAQAKAADTVAGRMSRGTTAARVSNDNEFQTRRDAGLIAGKTAAAVCKYGLRIDGRVYSIWVDMGEGVYYAQEGAPRDTDIFALTAADNGVNYILARRMEPEIASLADVYRLGLLRFSDESVQLAFETRLFPLFGIRATL